METSEEASSTNYYVRLNQLLFNETRKGCPEGIKLPEIEYFWLYLTAWAADRHGIKLYFAKGPKNQKYVWYPKSHCLIRMHERRIVYRFFRYQGLTPVSDIPEKQLERDLGAWLGSSDGSARIYRFFSNNSYKTLILRQIRLLLENWDGEIPPEPVHGQRHIASKIRVQFLPDKLQPRKNTLLVPKTRER